MDSTPEWLDDTWILRYHCPSSADWTLQSYTTLMNASDMADAWTIVEVLRLYVLKGIFFLMREHVFPSWDDQYNINGSCASFKVHNDRASECLTQVVKVVIGEGCICNGISSSPKRGFVIIKLWFPDIVTEKDIDMRSILPDYHGEVIFKSHKENIANNRI
jgi:hypothetical protein